MKNYRHQNEGDEELSCQRNPRPTCPRNRYYVPNSGISEFATQEPRYEIDSQHGTCELRRNIEESVPESDLAQAEERKRHRWIDVRSRLSSPRRIDNRNGG